MLQIVTNFLISFLGYKSYDLLSNYMIVGKKAIDYYAEAHLTQWNAFTHTFLMPTTMYGMLLWIPALLNLSPKLAKSLIYAIYYFYFGHYFKISPKGAAMFLLHYYISVLFSIKKWTSRNKPRNLELLKEGLIVSGTGLCLQEVIGHWFGGDIASRPEGVPNSILYAMYFSANHFM